MTVATDITIYGPSSDAISVVDVATRGLTNSANNGKWAQTVGGAVVWTPLPTLDLMPRAAGDVDLGGNNIIDAADAINPTDLATLRQIPTRQASTVPGAPLVADGSGAWQNVLLTLAGVAAPVALRALVMGVAGTVTATMTNAADFLVAAPAAMTLQRMKVSAKTAPSGAMTVQLRRSTNSGVSYSDVAGFVATFTGGAFLAVVDPADAAINEGDILNFSVATGSGTNLMVETVGYLT